MLTRKQAHSTPSATMENRKGSIPQTALHKGGTRVVLVLSDNERPPRAASVAALLRAGLWVASRGLQGLRGFGWFERELQGGFKGF